MTRYYNVYILGISPVIKLVVFTWNPLWNVPYLTMVFLCAQWTELDHFLSGFGSGIS